MWPDGCYDLSWSHHSMSRFFDALKEASRSRSNANGNPVGGEWETLASNGNELLNEAIATAAVAHPVLTPQPKLTATPALPHKDLPDLATRPQDNSLAPTIHIALDPAAPLITNTPTARLPQHGHQH